MDVWQTTLDARRSLLETFESLDDPQWETDSLCRGWRVRDVLAHLNFAMHPPLGRFVRGMVRRRGNYDRLSDELAREDGVRPISELLDSYRAEIDHRFSPPGWPEAAPLSDILLHSLDVRIPLGLPTGGGAEQWQPVLELLFTRMGRNFGAGSRPDVRWTATDLDWATGDGPVVSGRAEDLALTAAGRSARLDVLHGDGVPALRAWLA